MKKKILGLFLVMSIIFLLSSCIFELNGFEGKEYGDFVYYETAGGCTILDLTDEGRKKETLVFPSYIDGKKVVSIGFYLGFRRTITIFVTNANKVYVPATISSLYTSIVLNDEASLFMCRGLRFQGVKKYYVKPSIHFTDENHVANVIYYVDNQSYFIDDVDNDYITVIPPDPYKEGFNFIGWYKEEECINKWDFNIDKVKAKKYDSEGKFILEHEDVTKDEIKENKTSLYAKFEEVK